MKLLLCLSITTHHQLTVHSWVLFFVPQISHPPQLAVRPTHVCLCESWNNDSVNRLSNPLLSDASAPAGAVLPVQIINLRQQMGLRLSPLTSLPPSSLARAHAAWAYRLCFGCSLADFQFGLAFLKGPLDQRKRCRCKTFSLKAGLELIQTATSGPRSHVLIEEHG